MLTAVRNGAAHLAPTIASIRAQTFTDWEYLIVDDASTDATPSVLKEAARSDRRIRYIRRSSSGGPFAAANQGLHEALGRYIVRTDADDISLPGRIERQLAYLRAAPALYACAAFCQGLGDDGLMANAWNTAPLSSGVLRWHLCLRCNLVHSSACILRDALIDMGGYREEPLAQDYRMWCDLARRDRVSVMPEVLVYYRHHAARLTATRAEEQFRLARGVLQDHMSALTDERWSEAELDALMAVGHSRRFPLVAGLTALQRWDRAWEADPALTVAQRKELAAISAFRRRKFLRSNAKTQPAQVLQHVGQYLFPRPARHMREGRWRLR